MPAGYIRSSEKHVKNIPVPYSFAYKEEISFHSDKPPCFITSSPSPDESGFLSACVDAQAGPIPLQQVLY